MAEGRPLSPRSVFSPREPRPPWPRAPSGVGQKPELPWADFLQPGSFTLCSTAPPTLLFHSEQLCFLNETRLRQLARFGPGYPRSRVVRLCPAPLQTVVSVDLPSVWAYFGFKFCLLQKNMIPTMFHGSFLGFPAVLDVKQYHA